MFGGSADKLAGGCDTALRLWLGITHGVLFAAHTALKWIFPQIIPQTFRTGVIAFLLLHIRAWSMSTLGSSAGYTSILFL